MLQQWGIGEGLHSDQQIQERYARFEGLELGIAPDDQKPRMRQQLLSIEQNLASKQTDVGLVEDEFVLDLEREPSFFHRPTPFPPTQRSWIKAEMNRLCEAGIMKQVESCKTASRVVLVADGQSGQAFRMCYDFTDLNAFTKIIKYPMQDSRQLTDSCGGFTLFTVGDIKACFHNVMVHPDSQPYLGVATQDGLFICLRLPFGLHAAPAKVQALMDKALLGQPRANAFVDDITIKGHLDDWERLWQDSLAALQKLAHTGFMINLRKTKFLVPDITLLGLQVGTGTQQLGDKCIEGWQNIALPKTFKDIQVLLGKLVWASPFIPGYKTIVKPLEALLNRTNEGTWDSTCTAALNQLLALVHQRVQLVIADCNQPFMLYPAIEAGVMSVILTQNFSDGERAVAMIGRRATITEQKAAHIEQLLMTVSWGVRQLRRYTTFAPEIIVRVPQREVIAAIHDPYMHLRVRALIVDLQCYNTRWEFGRNILDAAGGIVDHTQLSTTTHTAQEPPPRIAHEDRVIRPPTTTKSLPTKVLEQPHWQVYFDGGSAGKQGTGGWIAFDPTGGVVAAHARWYGDDRPTVNSAEMQALEDALQGLLEMDTQGTPIVVIGDSKLIIDFCNRAARPQVTTLFLGLQRIRDLRSHLGKDRIFFRHVPRAQNRLADWLTNVARPCKCHVDATLECEGLSPTSEPPAPPSSRTRPEVIGGITEPKLKTKSGVQKRRPGRKKKGEATTSRKAVTARPLGPPDSCNVCKLPGGKLCWGCAYLFHPLCLGYSECVGPLYCPSCRTHYTDLGITDVTLDEELMAAVELGVPEGGSNRIRRAAAWFEWDGEGLYTTTGERRRVPPLKDRQSLVTTTAASLGYPGGGRIAALLGAKYYWANMKLDCVRWCQELLPNAIEAAKWKPPPHLHPWPKHRRPFYIWAVDLVTKLTPPGPNGETVMMVAVCAFTKWVEAGPLLNKSSWQTASWLHREIVCRFGVPATIRCDLGKEFQGAFQDYCREMGITISTVSRAHPRANGQCERYNGVIQAGLRRMIQSGMSGVWTELLPSVLAGLRQLPTYLGVAPYILVFKEGPLWLPEPTVVPGETPGECLLQGDLDSPEAAEQLIHLQRLWWDQQVELFREILKGKDETMKRYYARRKDLEEAGIAYNFQPGDQVLVKSALPGKFTSKALGPFRFTRYVGENKMAAEVATATGAVRREAIANLTPFRGSSKKLGKGPALHTARVQGDKLMRWHPGLPERELSSGVGTSDSESGSDV